LTEPNHELEPAKITTATARANPAKKPSPPERDIDSAPHPAWTKRPKQFADDPKHWALALSRALGITLAYAIHDGC